MKLHLSAAPIESPGDEACQAHLSTVSVLMYRISQLVEHWCSDWKVAVSIHGRSVVISFSEISLLTLIQCLSHPHLPQWLVKDPSHFARSTDGRLQVNSATLSVVNLSQGRVVPHYLK